ncbi:hypothetical protein Ari01nite_95490 [Paractinoplanes rishiriensis]|uniref:Uncharacterized protein n=1 Tax=Paractinoplanes rishiriensis TaxID=1050105 RepID=A0A919N045_9ACTN|nr:hypothetical protein Ari01nite_95490 [Actinoplanes rishiriensis]
MPPSREAKQALTPAPEDVVMVNGRGDLAGSIQDSDGSVVFGVWQRYDRWAGLGTVGDTYVHGMNQRGHVIGDDQHAVQGGFLWQGNRLTYLMMPDRVVWATAVSDHDQVVGDLSVPTGPGLQAFSWKNGSFTRLPTRTVCSVTPWTSTNAARCSGRWSTPTGRPGKGRCGTAAGSRWSADRTPPCGRSTTAVR